MLDNGKDVTLMTIKPDEQFMKNYQAIYYAMNAKPDCKSKIFGKDVTIKFQDLQDLNNKITEKFKAHYEDAGFIINITVSFRDRSSIEFNSWTTFSAYDWNIEKTINSILIMWEYNAQLPNYPLPQLHRLTVRLADEIRPEEMLNLVVSGKLQEVDKLDQEICPVVARVDFINSMLGDELLYIVERWQEGLEASSLENHVIYKYLKKYSRVLAYAINYIALFVSIWAGFRYLNKLFEELGTEKIGNIPINEIYSLFSSGIKILIAIFVVYKVFEIVANIVFSSLRQSTDNHTFNITKGDKNECKKIANTIRHKKLRIIGNIIFTIGYDIACSILTNHFL
jgi:hypothetical protein